MKDPERYSLAKDVVVIALIFGMVAGVAVAIGYGALLVYRGAKDAVVDYAGQIFDAEESGPEGQAEDDSEGPSSDTELEGTPVDDGKGDDAAQAPSADNAALRPTLTVHSERRIRRDGWLVSGLISNPSPLAIGGVTVRYELFDRKGRRLPERKAPIWVDGIHAGSSRPVSFLLAAPPRAGRYTLLGLESSPLELPPAAEGLVATVTEQMDSRGRFAAVGVVANTSPLPAFNVTIEVVGYASEAREKIVVVSTATLDLVVLQGSKKRYSANSQIYDESPAVVDVRAYGYRSPRH